MSGFASLLSQFKETTQAAAASTTSSNGGGSNKRSRSSFESSQTQPRQKQTKVTQENYYRYPSCTPIKTIYIACPANTETGGPEALHQLCHMINSGDYFYDDDNDDTDTNNAKKDDAVHDEFGRLITNNHNNSSSKPRVVKGKRQLKAFMLYLREHSSSASVEQVFGDRSPRPSKYNKYNAPMVEYNFPQHPLDSSTSRPSSAHGEYSSDLIIWPEVWTHLIDSLQPSESSASSNTTTTTTNHKKYQSAIWWLSVNNNKGRFASHQFTTRQDILHLVQSAYARDYVQTKLESGRRSGGEKKKHNKNEHQQHHVLTMTEFIPYTSSEFALPSIPTTTTMATGEYGGSSSNESKSNLVVYNPAKGMHWTDEIIRRACGKQVKTEWDGSVTSGGGIRFCPIGKGPGGRERMTGEEVVQLLKTAKVYIDFGPHPGMDRLPREATLAGCVVITNREGAANFDEDVPLPFKFAQFDVDKIYSLIKECCSKHDEYAKKMNKYKSWILNQRVQMKACVDGMVDEVVTKRISSCKKD